LPSPCCVAEAARKSKSAKPDYAVLLWRVASGHAHGKQWAQLAVGDFQPQGGKMRATIDLNVISRMVAVSVISLHYAHWLITVRSGYPSQYSFLGNVSRAKA
jgi:hypothetical protein